MNIIKNVTIINNEVKFKLNMDLFENFMFNLLGDNYIYMNESDIKKCGTYIENMINIKHKKKQIEYRHFSSDKSFKNITKFEIVNYFTDDDLSSYEDFFIDLEDITNDIISELYFDYIKQKDN
tara:strand:+ start:479 stop:847 length:369 start_codon:yes stop_codon:yes gene_type:complete